MEKQEILKGAIGKLDPGGRSTTSVKFKSDLIDYFMDKNFYLIKDNETAQFIFVNVNTILMFYLKGLADKLYSAEANIPLLVSWFNAKGPYNKPVPS